MGRISKECPIFILSLSHHLPTVFKWNVKKRQGLMNSFFGVGDIYRLSRLEIHRQFPAWLRIIRSGNHDMLHVVDTILWNSGTKPSIVPSSTVPGPQVIVIPSEPDGAPTTLILNAAPTVGSLWAKTTFSILHRSEPEVPDPI